MIVKKQKRLLVPAILVMLVLSCAMTDRLPVLGQNDVVVAFGDSLTFGTGALPDESYPAVLEQMIGTRVVNAGLPGDVSAHALLRLPEVLDHEKPLIVIICIGGNDFLRRIDKKEIKNNIRSMIQMARDRAAAVVLVATPQLGVTLASDPIYREIAGELKVPLEAKVLSEVLSDRNLKSDLIHPNASGYRRLAESIAALLRKSGAIER